jgi:hypothetical protein
MRKTHLAGRKPSDRIVVRAEHGRGEARANGPVPRGVRDLPKPAKRLAGVRKGATMDYQMGFTSGPSN